MLSAIPKPNPHPTCEKFRIDKTELGSEKGSSVAVCVLNAPCKGTVTAYAGFVSALDGAKPSTARLSGTILDQNFDRSDVNFTATNLEISPQAIPVMEGNDVIFKTERSNSSAKTTKWEMWLRFDPS